MMFMKSKQLSHTTETRAEVAAAAQFPTMKSFFSEHKLKLSEKPTPVWHLRGSAFDFMSRLTAFRWLMTVQWAHVVCVCVFHNLGVKETEALIGWLLICSMNMTRCVSLFIFINVIWSCRFKDTSPRFWEIKSNSAVGGSSLSRIWFKDWSCCGPAPESWLPSLCPWKRAFTECLLLKHRGWGVEVGLEHT